MIRVLKLPDHVSGYLPAWSFVEHRVDSAPAIKLNMVESTLYGRSKDKIDPSY